jgi:putative ABC transport system permease protein
MLTHWLQDLRQAVRVLLARPGFTLAAVLALAVGIGVNTALFSVLKAVVFDPLPYPQSQQLLSVAQANTATERNPITVGYATFVDWQRELHSFESMAAFADWQASIAAEGDAQMVTGMRVTPRFFATLGIAPALGRTFTEAEDQSAQHDVVILAHGLWQRELGGDPNVIGRKLRVNGRDRTVVGVMPATFQSPYFGNVAGAPEIWLPLGYRLGDSFACRDCQHLQAIGRLKPGADIEAARAELDAFAPRLIHEYPQSYPPTTHFLAKPLLAAVIGSAPTPLWLLFAAAGLVLLIACVDLGNLVLVRAQARQREIAVRSALGASRGRVAQLLLSESLLLAAAGGVLSLLAARAAVSAFARYAGDALPRLDHVALDAPVLAFALLLSLAVALLTGLWPALRASLTAPDAALSSGARTLGGARLARVQRALTIAQIALALMLAIGALLVLRSFAGLLRVDPGFDAHDLVGMNVSVAGPRYADAQASADFYRTLVERLRAQPGVQAVAAVTPLPLSGGFDRAGFHIKDRPIPPQQAPEVDRFIAEPGYFAALRIPLLRGRDFSADDRAANASVAIVSDTLARTMWPNEDALGKQIQLGGRDENAPWASVIGVVGDVRQYGLDSAATAQAYLPQAQQPAGFMALLIRSTLPAQTLAGMARAAVREIDSAVPVFAVIQMQQRLSDSLARRRLTLTLLIAFACTALALAALGVYGVVSYAIAQHTQAIGVRRALGADNADIWRWVLSRCAGFAVLGVAIGIPGALLWGRLLASELVGVSPYDPLSLGGAVLLLGAVVLGAAFGPARRAMRVPPTIALRSE